MCLTFYDKEMAVRYAVLLFSTRASGFMEMGGRSEVRCCCERKKTKYAHHLSLPLTRNRISDWTAVSVVRPRHELMARSYVTS